MNYQLAATDAERRGARKIVNAAVDAGLSTPTAYALALDWQKLAAAERVAKGGQR